MRGSGREGGVYFDEVVMLKLGVAVLTVRRCL